MFAAFTLETLAARQANKTQKSQLLETYINIKSR